VGREDPAKLNLLGDLTPPWHSHGTVAVMIQIQGRQIDYAESGAGPVVLFVPGSYSTVAAWRPIQRLLKLGLRLVTTSICGYGKSADTRSIGDTGMHHEVQLIEAVARHAGQPVHLVGHSFGGTVALATALSGKVPVLSLSLFEANPINLIRERDGGELFRSTQRMSRDFETAVRAGERDAAGRIIDFWGGAGVYNAMPEAVREYCRGTAQVNVLDWRTVFSFAVTPDDCSGPALSVPVLLVRGGLANAAMVSITSVLAESLAQPRPHVVEGAGHFLISSHPEACAALLSSFLDEVVRH
jgi:pimeloyl-ACP methyl ester carboxylesterase